MTTTKFYVPEIGDKITLAEDFTFSLYGENRNEDLATLFGYYIMHNRGSGFLVNSSDLPPMREIDYTVNYPDKEKFQKWRGSLDCVAYNKASKVAEESCLERIKYYEDYRAHREAASKIGNPFIPVTLPKGTELIVDRIYIRKGASDFSSITFRTNSLGSVVRTQGWTKTKVNKKSLRFWVKLQECNTIVFES